MYYYPEHNSTTYSTTSPFACVCCSLSDNSAALRLSSSCFSNDGLRE